MNTVKTHVEEPSDLRTYRLKLGILIPKYILEPIQPGKEKQVHIQKNTLIL